MPAFSILRLCLEVSFLESRSVSLSLLENRVVILGQRFNTAFWEGEKRKNDINWTKGENHEEFYRFGLDSTIVSHKIR